MIQSGRVSSCIPVIVALLAITAVFALACGCSRQVTLPQVSPTPSMTTGTSGTPLHATPVPEGKKMITFTEKDNGTTAEIAAGTTFAVQLAENPTTGYSWNASTSPGLIVLSSEYNESGHPEGMVGAGGTHTWILQAGGSGSQTFAAIYKQPWMPASGNDTSYTLSVRIVTI